MQNTPQQMKAMPKIVRFYEFGEADLTVRVIPDVKIPAHARRGHCQLP